MQVVPEWEVVSLEVRQEVSAEPAAEVQREVFRGVLWEVSHKAYTAPVHLEAHKVLVGICSGSFQVVLEWEVHPACKACTAQVHLEAHKVLVCI